MDEAFAAPKAYEGYIGRWSRVVAGEFVPWLGIPRQAAWCEVACGTGALTSAVLSSTDPLRIDASDPSDERVSFARQTITDSRANFTLGFGTDILAADRSFDAIIGGLAFPAIRDTPAALAEFRRVARPGATIAAYVWDFDGEMQLVRSFWNAANDVEPHVEEGDDDERFAICRPDRLQATWQEAGLSAIAVRAIDARARFVDFDDMWTPFLSGDSPAQRFAQSLAAPRRALLRTQLRKRLPIAADGSITLVIRAWAVTGRK